MSDPVVKRELISDDGVNRWERITYASGLVVNSGTNIAAEREVLEQISRQLRKDRNGASKL